MPRPTTPSTTTIDTHAASTAHGYVTAKRVSAGVRLPPPLECGCMVGPLEAMRSSGPAAG